MIYNFRILTVLLLLNLTSSLNGRSDRYRGNIYHGTDLSLCLLDNGVMSFLSESKTHDTKEYKDALKDIIKRASENRTDVPTILKEISKTLHSKIERIIRIKDETVDTKQLAIGAGLITVSVALTYALYYFYKNWYVANRLECDAIKKSLAKHGIKIVTHDRGLNIKALSPLSSDDYDAIQRFDNLRDSNAFLGGGLFGLGPIVSAFSCLAGILCLYNGFNPHSDDNYLDKYQNMLEITNKLQDAIKA
jgi:hypothetical protein